MTAQEYVKKFLGEEHPDIYMEAIEHMPPSYQARYNAAEEDLEVKGRNWPPKSWQSWAFPGRRS